MIVGIEGKCIVTTMKYSVLFYLFSVDLNLHFKSMAMRRSTYKQQTKQRGTLFTPDCIKIVLSLIRMIAFEHNFILHIIAI